MDPLFSTLITKCRDRMVWVVNADYNGPDNPDVLHGPFDYPGAIQRKEDIESGVYGDHKKARILLDLMELG